MALLASPARDAGTQATNGANQRGRRLSVKATISAEAAGAISQNPTRALAVVQDFSSRLILLDYGSRAAAHYGGIRAHLEGLGTPIGVNDLHIAAHARSEGLTLVSSNLYEFERVPGLLMENWAGDAG